MGSGIRLLFYLLIGSTGRDTGSRDQQIVCPMDDSDATCTGYIPASDHTLMHPICELLESLREWYPMQLIHFGKVNVDALPLDDVVQIRIRHTECTGAAIPIYLKPGWVACNKCWHAGILVLQQIEKYLPRFAALDVMAAYNLGDTVKADGIRNALRTSELCKAGHSFEALRL